MTNVIHASRLGKKNYIIFLFSFLLSTSVYRSNQLMWKKELLMCVKSRVPACVKCVYQFFSREKQGHDSNSYQFCRHSFFGNSVIRITSMTLFFPRKKLIHTFDTKLKELEFSCQIVTNPYTLKMNRMGHW
jgi:hypothetical protein